jgi:hypothetical protein
LDGLASLIENLKQSEDYYALLGLLQILDHAMVNLLNQAVDDFEQENFSIVLNTNRETVGIGLLPRCSCVWERKHRLVHRYNHLESFLYNILVLENSVLGDLIDKHYFLKKNLFPHFTERNALKIAATPLSLNRHFKVQLVDHDKVQYFNITYDAPSFESDNELIWQKIWTAAENNSDIVVFPDCLLVRLAAALKRLFPCAAAHLGADDSSDPVAVPLEILLDLAIPRQALRHRNPGVVFHVISGLQRRLANAALVLVVKPSADRAKPLQPNRLHLVGRKSHRV